MYVVYTSNTFLPPQRWSPACPGTAVPIRAVRHRIDRNLAQELQLPAGRVVRRRHALDERLEIRRVAFVARLELESAGFALIGRVLELVDRCPHLPQRASQLRFPLPLRGDLEPSA